MTDRLTDAIIADNELEVDFDILSLSTTASLDEVKERWREIVKVLRPDKLDLGDDWFDYLVREEAFSRIGDAFEEGRTSRRPEHRIRFQEEQRWRCYWLSGSMHQEKHHDEPESDPNRWDEAEETGTAEEPRTKPQPTSGRPAPPPPWHEEDRVRTRPRPVSKSFERDGLFWVTGGFILRAAIVGTLIGIAVAGHGLGLLDHLWRFEVGIPPGGSVVSTSPSSQGNPLLGLLALPVVLVAVLGVLAVVASSVVGLGAMVIGCVNSPVFVWGLGVFVAASVGAVIVGLLFRLVHVMG